MRQAYDYWQDQPGNYLIKKKKKEKIKKTFFFFFFFFFKINEKRLFKKDKLHDIKNLISKIIIIK